jgi:glucosamine--fructose-6-phosphate aminotransferase (isomerizing)
VVAGLKRLEYRGYDSAGVAVQNGRGIITRKVKGRVKGLDRVVARHPVHGCSGIGHTRWATHGVPNRLNAHPHRGCDRRFSIVHNGIIENARDLRRMLERAGHRFRTETDTEVLAHLLEEMPGSVLEQKLAESLRLVEGTFGVATMSSAEPGKIVAARRGSPLLIGIGDGEHFVASDPSAILEYTRRVVYLEDGDLAVVTADGYQISDIGHAVQLRSEREISWTAESISVGSYEHYMLKEIHEQPDTVTNTLRGRLGEQGPVRLNGLGLSGAEAAALRRVTVLACGTSWHSGLIARYLIEQVVGIPVRVEYASEYRYQPQLEVADSLVVAISQSGETADTLEAMRAAKGAGARVVGIVNVVGSSIARESAGGIYLHAGPEIGVASTKAFTSQITALVLLTLHLAELRGVAAEQVARIRVELLRIPSLIREALELEPEVAEIARTFVDATNCLYLGRGVSYPVAMEGALKLKEISYIHAEGLPAAEMKHGPIALIDENMPVVFVAPRDPVYEKIVSTMEEVRARNGRIVAISTAGNGDLSRLAHHELRVPDTLPELTPLLTAIPLQLLAYHVARLRGCDVDRPRNLAKSVTVE